MKRNILVIGSGGREHALCKKLLESPKVANVYCAKGNDGMTLDGIKVIDIAEDNHDELIKFAKEQEITWALVGPEVPLMNGLVDDFKAQGIKAFGPSKEAALIEGSKEFAKELMMNNNIPTAAYESFSDFNKALCYVEEGTFPVVIKADGLAAGKGVIIAQTLEEAKKALADILLDNYFGNDEPKVVIEEFLVGREFSLLSFVNETGIYPMVAAKDHKAIFDGDKGPNTGGMGAYSPVDYVTKEIEQEVLTTIIEPTIQGMKELNKPFEGILYTGLILTEEGPKVIEYNARFGDPETQVLLERLISDLSDVVDDLLNQRVPKIEWKEEGISLGVVVSAKGYPGEYEKNSPLPDFETADVKIFYSGVKQEEKRLVSAGGRVFLAAATANSKEEAHEKVYTWLHQQPLANFYYRQDIGKIV